MHHIQIAAKHKCPKLPWMVDFHKTGDVMNCQLEAAFQGSHLEHLMKLSSKSRVGRKRLTQLLVHVPSRTPPNLVEDLLIAGMSTAVVRVHKMGYFETERQLDAIKDAAKSFNEKTGRTFPLAVALDIPDPEIRTGRSNKSGGKSMELEKGQLTKITSNPIYANQLSKDMIYVDYEQIGQLVKPGDSIIIDGTIHLEALEVAKEVIECIINNTGILDDSLSVTIPNKPLTLPYTEVQENFLKLALEQKVDMVIIGDDLFDLAKEVLGGSVSFILKLESGRYVDKFDDIVDKYDAVMLDCDQLIMSQNERVFLVQKAIAAKCNNLGKPLINCLPARSMSKQFVFDIANSVIDGCDAVLLAPDAEIVQSASLVCKAAEMAVYQKQLFENLTALHPPPIEPIMSLSIAAVEAAYKCNAAAILLLTSSGRSAKLLSQFRPRCPIIALTRYGRVAKQLMLYRGVVPFFYVRNSNVGLDKTDHIIQLGMTFGKLNGYIRMGDAVVIAFGIHHTLGFRNCIEIVYASEHDTREDDG